MGVVFEETLDTATGELDKEEARSIVAIANGKCKNGNFIDDVETLRLVDDDGMGITRDSPHPYDKWQLRC